jgi:hypothetical protein
MVVSFARHGDDDDKEEAVALNGVPAVLVV